MRLINNTLLFGICLSLLVMILANNAVYGQLHKAKNVKRPNIIVFLVDDMGWMDTSEPFGDRPYPLNNTYHTPNMEKLAAQGMKFTNAYATPVCTPSRVSMLTGMNAAHHGVTHWTSIHKDTPSDHQDSIFHRVEWNYNGFSPIGGIPHTATATPLPQLLQDAGYYTVHVGKAHWGAQGTPGANPLNLGFMVNVAGNAIGHPQSYYGKDNYGNIPGKFTFNAVQGLAEYYGTDTFLTEALTQEAIKCIEPAVEAGKPFYLHLAHYAVHDPIQGDPRFVQKYLARGLNPREAKYASMVEGMDKSLGDLMQYLEDQGLAENTVILFMSDNGGLSLGYARGGEPHTQNYPLKAGKGSVYEGGIRVPMIVAWPGVTEPGSSSAQPVIIEDFFPSILEIADIHASDLTQKIDGKSFAPILKNEDSRHSERLLIWHSPHRWINDAGPGINFFSAARQGNWKLIYDHRQQKLELYDLSKDISEQHNVILKHKKIARSLSRQLTDQLKKWGATMPTYRINQERVPWPEESDN